MTCREIFRALSQYLDNELDETLCQNLEYHIHSCKPCEAFLNTLRKTLEICRQHEPDSKSEITISPEVKEQLRETYEKLAQSLSGGASR
jgi:hypothetical protein